MKIDMVALESVRASLTPPILTKALELKFRLKNLEEKSREITRKIDNEATQRKYQLERTIDWAKNVFRGLDENLKLQKEKSSQVHEQNEAKNQQINELQKSLAKVIKENEHLRQKIKDGNIDMEIRVSRLGEFPATFSN